MTDEKKRFPWWLWTGALVLLLLAAVVTLIETVGRRGTVVGRFQRIKPGMSGSEVFGIVGPSARFSGFDASGSVKRQTPTGREIDGPFELEINFNEVVGHGKYVRGVLLPYELDDISVREVGLRSHKVEYLALGWWARPPLGRASLHGDPRTAPLRGFCAATPVFVQREVIVQSPVRRGDCLSAFLSGVHYTNPVACLPAPGYTPALCTRVRHSYRTTSGRNEAAAIEKEKQALAPGQRVGWLIACKQRGRRFQAPPTGLWSLRMIFVWRGKGFLALLGAIIPLSLFIVTLLVEQEARPGQNIIFSPLVMALGGLGAGCLCWWLGRKWNRKRNVHTLYWIPLQHWGVVYIVAGALLMLLVMVKLLM